MTLIRSKIWISGISGILAMTSLGSCSHSAQWEAKGTVAGGEGREMLLQASTNGRWYTIDTVEIDKNGKFSVTQSPAGYPDIYRLSLDGKNLYFPVDSIETVVITADVDGFDTGYTLSGTPSAENLMKANAELNAVIRAQGVEKALKDTELKKKLNDIILSNPSDIVSYYIISRNVQGSPLYDPTDRDDVKLIGAVANAFNDYRTRDPRTSYLKSLFLSNRVRNVAPTDTIHAEEVSYFDIKLYDENGNIRSLKELTEKGKVVLLNFTVYNAENSPAFNRQLNELYQRYHDAGLEIYQVSIDSDEFRWKQSARNLPWITVYNSPVDGRQNLLNFNVTAIPTSFVIDRNGDLVERIDDESQLASKVRAHI